MKSLLPILFSLLMVSTLGFGGRWMLRYTNKKIWHSQLLDRFAVALPYLSYISLAMMGVGIRLQIGVLTSTGVIALAVFTVLSAILIVSLPLSSLIHRIARAVSAMVTPVEKHSFNPARRRFLKTTAAALPVVSIAATSRGFAGALNTVNTPEIALSFNHLPGDLEGLRILHLSDLHLGYYFQLEDLEHLLTAVEDKRVDLVLVTGDIADDLNQLKPALSLIDQLPTKLPGLVSLGNHEYIRGIKEARRQFDASPVPLLVNSGQRIKVGNASLFIGGADDPVQLHAEVQNFLDATTAKSMREATDSDFKILMSHRPRALDVAGKYGVDLVLAGHTHGGQIGVNGRSVFENMMNDRYMWGKYRQGQTQLYTSSGVGHWFPFRLGCPAEAPLITLHRTDHNTEKIS